MTNQFSNLNLISEFVDSLSIADLHFFAGDSDQLGNLCQARLLLIDSQVLVLNHKDPRTTIECLYDLVLCGAMSLDHYYAILLNRLNLLY